MTTKKERQARQREVYLLKLQGMTAAAIAQAKGLSERQIKKDIRIIRERNAKENNAETRDTVTSDFIEKAQARIGRLWKIVADNTAKKSEIIKCLRELREEDTLAFERYQSLGVMPKATMIIGGALPAGEISQASQPVQITIVRRPKLEPKPEAKQIEDKKNEPEPNDTDSQH